MDRRDRLLLILTAIATCVAVFAVGGAPGWAQAAVAAVTSAGLVVSAFSRRGLARLSPLLMLLLGASAWTLLQVVPLPTGLVEALSPTLASLRADGAAIADVPMWSSFSMDPPATLRGLAFLLTLSGVAIVALRLSVTQRGRYALLACVAIVIGAAAVSAGLHELLGASELYGLYRPVQAQPPILGPLLNPNHLGCLMAVGAVTAAGLLLYPKQTTARRMVWVMIGVACLAVLGASRSRGAMIAFGVGAVAMLVTLFIQRAQSLTEKKSRRRREQFLATTVPVGVMIVCGLVVALYIGAGSVMHQLENTSLREIDAPTSKFAAWRSSVTLIEESPWIGIGRGAFEPAFTRVHPASAFSTFSHPENIGLQAVVDWGVPAMLFLAIGAAWFVIAALSRWKEGPLAAAALGVLGVVGFQSNFDFGLELLGVAVPVTVLAATLSYVPLKELVAARLRRARIVRGIHALAIATGAVALLTPATETIEEAHVALRGAPSTAAIRERIARHPLDYYAYAVLAEHMIRAREPDAIRTLNHALRLHPTHPGLHRVAARLLLRAGRTAQAESEYSTAIRYSVVLRPVLAELIAAMSIDSVVRAIPVEGGVDQVLRPLYALQRADIAIPWLERVLAYRPSLHVAELLHSLALEHKAYGAAEAAARTRCKLLPSTQCQLALARVLTFAEKPQQVIAELQEIWTWRGRRDEQLAAWFLLCDAHIALQAVGDAKECLRRLDASGLVTPNHPEIVRRREELPAPPPGTLIPPMPGR